MESVVAGLIWKFSREIPRLRFFGNLLQPQCLSASYVYFLQYCFILLWMGFLAFLHINQIKTMTLQTQICATEQTLILHAQGKCYCLFHYYGNTTELKQTLICHRLKQHFIINYTRNLTPLVTLRKRRYQAKSFTLSKKHNIIYYHFQHSKLIKRRKKIMHMPDLIIWEHELNISLLYFDSLSSLQI